MNDPGHISDIIERAGGSQRCGHVDYGLDGSLDTVPNQLTGHTYEIIFCYSTSHTIHGVAELANMTQWSMPPEPNSLAVRGRINTDTHQNELEDGGG